MDGGAADERLKTKTKEKKKGAEVLEDDEYVERLGRIIRRDYYPDLHQAYVKGLLTEHESDKFKYKNKYEADSLTVDQFHQKFTSEDNESFQVLHEHDKEQHKRKYWWAFQNDITDQRLLLTNGEAASGQQRLTDSKRQQKKLKNNIRLAAVNKATGLNRDATRFGEQDVRDDTSEFSMVTAQTEMIVPSVNGYTFVTAPKPYVKQKLKQKEVVARPSSVQSEFKMNAQSAREKKAHALARKIESSKRRSRRDELERQRRSTPLYKSGQSKKRPMTPAAQALAKRLGSVKKPK